MPHLKYGDASIPLVHFAKGYQLKFFDALCPDMHRKHEDK